MTKMRSQTKNQQRIIHLFQKCGQSKDCYYAYQLMDSEEQRYVEHILTTINTKGYMPA